MARNSGTPLLLVSKSRQRFAKMLVERFGTIEAVNEAIRKIRIDGMTDTTGHGAQIGIPLD